jgi:hydrogenase nickel incorporation protein HypB
MTILTIERRVLEKNDEIARQNRERFLENRMFAVNLISSPGSGKTSIVERTLEAIGQRVRVGVVEGDVQTDLDAQRVARFGVPVVQIVTNGGCHLEAQLVRNAVENLDLNAVDLLIIENVGNLVCPANYDLGEHLKVVVVSTTEGDDKPLKYPGIFRHASVLIINKTDLLLYIDCNVEQLKANARAMNPSLLMFETSCKTGEGIQEWCSWLVSQTEATSQRVRER